MQWFIQHIGIKNQVFHIWQINLTLLNREEKRNRILWLLNIKVLKIMISMYGKLLNPSQQKRRNKRLDYISFSLFHTHSNILKSTKFPILISNVRMLIILEYGNFSFIEQIKLVSRAFCMHNWSGKIGNINWNWSGNLHPLLLWSKAKLDCHQGFLLHNWLIKNR